MRHAQYILAISECWVHGTKCHLQPHHLNLDTPCNWICHPPFSSGEETESVGATQKGAGLGFLNQGYLQNQGSGVLLPPSGNLGNLLKHLWYLV